MNSPKEKNEEEVVMVLKSATDRCQSIETTAQVNNPKNLYVGACFTFVF